MDFFDNLGKKINDVSQTTIQKTKQIADIAKINALISDEERHENEAYTMLGKAFFEKHQEDENVDESIKEAFDAVSTAKKNIADYEAQLIAIKNEGKCPKCGAEVDKDAKFCPSCGAQMPEKPVEEPKEEPKPVKPVCAKCGAVLEEGQKFCMVCGEPVPQPEVESVSGTVEETKSEN